MEAQEKIDKHYRKNFDRLVKKYSFRAGTIWNAEDVVQEAYTSAFQYFHAYNPEMPFDAWFNRILNNSLRTFKRKEKGHIAEEFDEKDVDGIDDGNLHREIWKEILEAADQCNDEHSEVLRLYFIQGFAPSDIVKITDLKYKNITIILDRFKRMIRERYGET